MQEARGKKKLEIRKAESEKRNFGLRIADCGSGKKEIRKDRKE